MDGSVHDFLKNSNVVSGFAIMAKTYHDNGNDSVFGKDYLDKSKHRLISAKNHEYEATFNLNPKLSN